MSKISDEVSLRALPLEEITWRINQFERNRDPHHLNKLRDGVIQPGNDEEAVYLELVGELTYRQDVMGQD